MDILSLYGFYQDTRPTHLERGSVVFASQEAVLMLTYSSLGLKEFHPLRVEVNKSDVYMVSMGAFVLLKQALTFESEEYT